MARLKKELLRIGKYHPPGMETPFIVTKADLDEVHRNGNALVAAGDAPPWGWEHQADLVPMSLMEKAGDRAKHHITYSAGFEMSDDGTKVYSVADVPDADQPQVEKVGFVSPGLQRDLKTGDGTVYPGWSPIHVAVTPRPVNKNQEHFVAMSAVLPSQIVCLSLADMSAETETAVEEAKAEGAATEDKPEAEPVDPDTAKLRDATDILAQCGLMLGEDTTAANFVDRVIVAGQTYLAAQGEIAETVSDGNTGLASAGSPPADAKPAQMGTGGVTLSLEQQTAVKDARLISHGRAELAARINKLIKTGRIPPVTGRALNSDLNKVNLSLAQDGSIASTPLLVRIEAYEALPKGNTGFDGTRVNLSNAQAVELPPEQTGGPTTPEQAKAAVDRFFDTTSQGRVKRK